jgi:hypothetical protein
MPENVDDHDRACGSLSAFQNAVDRDFHPLFYCGF